MAQQRGVNSLQFNQDQSKLVANTELPVSLPATRISCICFHFLFFFFRLQAVSAALWRLGSGFITWSP